MSERWIQKAGIKKGALHHQLGYSQSNHIPIGLLQRIQQQGIGSHVQAQGRTITVTSKLKKRVNFALNIRRPPR